MYTNKIKYCAAVAVLTIATALCACDDGSGEEIIEITQTGDEANTAATRDLPDDMQKEAESTFRVYVCGAVRLPDVYELPEGVRLVDAVKAAGGFTDDAGYEYLNLAAPLSDGQKIYIPTQKEVEDAIESGEELYASTVNITSNSPGIQTGDSAQNSDGNSKKSDSGKVNINQADKSALMTLPGIGASKADKIIAFRDSNGGFASIEDIMLVDGIKEGMFNKIKDSICVK